MWLCSTGLLFFLLGSHPLTFCSICIWLACMIKHPQHIAAPQWNPYEERDGAREGGVEGEGCTLSPHAASQTWLSSGRQEWESNNALTSRSFHPCMHTHTHIYKKCVSLPQLVVWGTLPHFVHCIPSSSNIQITVWECTPSHPPLLAPLHVVFFSSSVTRCVYIFISSWKPERSSMALHTLTFTQSFET